jgi:glycine cleavage system T protein (aminomethyltransferase)
MAQEDRADQRDMPPLIRSFVCPEVLVDEQDAGPETALLRTPLYAEHVALKAKMAPFGGWEMPIGYGSILEEHRATRTAAGLFDLSHMGEFVIAGPQAPAFVAALLTNDPQALAPGQGLYSPMCRDDGTIVDDVILYLLPDDPPARYLLVVNAANRAKDWAWVQEVRDLEGLDGVVLEDRSDDFALIAVQGPRAAALLADVQGEVVAGLGSFAIAEFPVYGTAAFVARTGYTGEDGFEIFVAPAAAPELWRTLLARGAAAGLRPVGLGARDTLRLEARLPLYGNDLDDTTTPLEAGLSRFVKLDKAHFRGQAALQEQKRNGVTQRLAGLEMGDRSIPRAHYPVLDASGAQIGSVTSGSFSPTLGRGIALAYLPPEQAVVGTPLQIAIRGEGHPAIVVKTPFYRRSK